MLQAEASQHAFRRQMLAWWEDGWDLLVTPTTAQPAPRIGELASDPDEPFGSLLKQIPYAVYTSAFNVSGQPGLSVPAGVSADGVPVGVQLVAAYGREDLLIQVGAQLEAELDWASRRAPIHA